MIVQPTSFLREQYKLVEDSYTGQGGFATGDYLYPYAREMDFAERRDMAVYLNFIRPVVDARVDPVFVGQTQRTYDDNPIVETFIRNADNNNTPLEDMIHLATTETVLLGNSFIVMDNFPAEDIPESVAEAVEYRKLPYIYSKSVLDVYQYEVDIFGRLKEITFYYGVWDNADADETLYLYKRFTNCEIEHFTMRKNEKGEYDKQTIKIVPHTLARVPVAYYNKEVLPFAPYYSMATLARHIYNINSELTDLERAQMFSILLVPSTYQGNEAQDNLVVSSSNALFFDAQATNKPEYIAPDSNIMKVQMENRQQSIETLIQSADVLGTTAISTGNSASSGIAESYKFFGKQNALMQSAQIATDLESQVMDILGVFIGYDIDYTVVYPNAFSPTFAEVKSKVEAYASIADMDISDLVSATMNAEIVKIVSEVAGIEDEELAEMLESITEVSEII